MRAMSILRVVAMMILGGCASVGWNLNESVEVSVERSHCLQ